MLVALALLFVGVVLMLNSLWMLGRIADREIVLINLIVTAITASIAGFTAFGAATDMGAVKSAALTLLFSTTYLWVAYNRLTGVDGRGLGWFSLIVAITVVPAALQDISAAHSILSLWLGVNWAIWSVLWLLYFLLLSLQWPIQRATAIFTLVTGVVTGWLPAMLMLYGVLR